MYVTSGQYKGRKIIVPKCAKPTLSKSREGVFNVLFSYMHSFQDKTFLDMFSGSGIMSLEALSRGFKTVSLDINPAAVKIIKKNLSVAKSGYEVYCVDSLKFISNLNYSPDVIYIDPPWEFNYKDILLAVFNKFKGSIIVVESDKKTAQKLSDIYSDNFAPFKEKVYGRSKLDFFING